MTGGSELSCHAVLVAGGSSRRMGFDKLLAKVHGRAVIEWTARVFDSHPAVCGLVVVARGDAVDTVAGLFGGLIKPVRVVAGGGWRHESVWNGLEALDAGPRDLVAVHDAARPLVSADAISRCVEAAARCGAAACARAVRDTLKRSSHGGFVGTGIDRDGVWAMETPQVMRLGLLREASRRAIESGERVTDETSAMTAAGYPVRLIETGSLNIKVTVPSDLDLLARLLPDGKRT